MFINNYISVDLSAVILLIVSVFDFGLLEGLLLLRIISLLGFKVRWIPHSRANLPLCDELRFKTQCDTCQSPYTIVLCVCQSINRGPSPATRHAQTCSIWTSLHRAPASPKEYSNLFILDLTTLWPWLPLSQRHSYLFIMQPKLLTTCTADTWLKVAFEVKGHWLVLWYLFWICLWYFLRISRRNLHQSCHINPFDCGILLWITFLWHGGFLLFLINLIIRNLSAINMIQSTGRERLIRTWLIRSST